MPSRYGTATKLVSMAPETDEEWAVSLSPGLGSQKAWIGSTGPEWCTRQGRRCGVALGVSPAGSSDFNAKPGIDCDMASGLDDASGTCKKVGPSLAWDAEWVCETRV